MAITQRRVLVCLFAAGVAMFPSDSEAQGRRRARLSEDLVERLRTGDTTETSVIVTDTQARINALAERHGLRIRKRLQNGAVLDVPAGQLSYVAAILGSITIRPSRDARAHGSVVTSTGADQV